MNLKFTFSLLMVLLSLHAAHSIKCWECRSDIYPKCGQPFDNSTFPLINCSLDQRFEGKSKGCLMMKKKENGIWVYYRTCTPSPPEEPQFDNALCSNSNVECHTCYENDGCNASCQVPLSSWFMLFPLVTFFLRI